MRQPAYDISIILPFSDDEDCIGTACRRLARHLHELGAAFEILAVDEDSGDNSHAVLALLRSSIPELRVAGAASPGRGFALGARLARGRVLWLIGARAAAGPLAPFGRARRRILAGDADLVVMENRFSACHRTRCLPVVEAVRAGPGYERRLARRARARRLAVEVYPGASAAPEERPRAPRFARLLGALAPTRAALAERWRS